MKTHGITVAGSMLVDYIKKVDSYAPKGMLCNITEIIRNIGGCAPNTLVDLSILDPSLSLKCVGAVGNDSDGEFLKNFLLEKSIDISDIITLPNAPTSFTDVMTESTTGERTFFQARGANIYFNENHIPYSRLYDGIFHIGYALLLDAFDAPDAKYGTVMARVLENVQKLGIATSMDVVSEDSSRFSQVVQPALKYLNYFISNEIEAGRTVGINARDSNKKIDVNSIKKICLHILDLGVQDCVVIHAPEGAWAMTKTKEFFSAPSLNLPQDFIIGSVGAGDAFCAAMLLAFYKRIPIMEALKGANAVAACNLTAIDSISGMKSWNEAQKLYNVYSCRTLSDE